MAKPERLPSGNYRASIYIGKDANGKRVRHSVTAPTRRECELCAAQFIREHANAGGLIAHPSKMTVAQAVDAYIAARDNVLSPSTIRGYETIKRHQIRDIHTITLDALTQETIQAWVNRLAAKHAPKTCRNACGLMTAVLREYRPAFAPRVKLPQSDKPGIVIPTPSELDNLIAEADAITRCIVLLAADCGLRRSEMAALVWDDVDLSTCAVTVNKATVYDKSRVQRIKKPKSVAGYRTICASQRVIDALAALPRATDRVLNLSPIAIASRFERLARRLGGVYSLHDLRHYCASVMLALGVPDKYAMERMGHSTEGILRKVYQHTMQERTAEFAQKINAFMDGLSNARDDSPRGST